MAAFGVHLGVGLTVSGVAATTALVAGLATPGQTLACLGLGTLGSLLPDLDADSSAPVKVSFTLAAVGLAFLAMFLSTDRFPSVAELLAVWVTTFLLARWLLFAVLTRVTVHRGMLHSLPAAAFFGMACAAVAHRTLDTPPLIAWTAGAFVTLGYLVHLLLDEVYSVNLFGARTRRSLGSATKLWSRRGAAASLATYLAAVAAFVLAPPPDPLVDALTDPTWQGQVRDRLWPHHGWFQAIPPRPQAISGRRANTSDHG